MARLNNLKKYITSYNEFQKLWHNAGGTPPRHIDINNMTAEDKEVLAREICRDLSPECLTCDGEVRGAALRRKSQYIHAVKAEAESEGIVVPAW